MKLKLMASGLALGLFALLGACSTPSDSTAPDAGVDPNAPATEEPGVAPDSTEAMPDTGTTTEPTDPTLESDPTDPTTTKGDSMGTTESDPMGTTETDPMGTTDPMESTDPATQPGTAEPGPQG